MMRIHHINCGNLRPWGGRIVDGFSHGGEARLVCHCWLIETASGLVLVDTGLGSDDLLERQGRLSSFYQTLHRPQISAGLTAERQVRRMGFSPSDVRHIILTHLDCDQAGGISDFPRAQVHVLRDEWSAATERRSWMGRRRYRPEQWQHHPFWNFYEANPQHRWFGFECVRNLMGLPPEIVLVPLRGHTQGHTGVAVKMPHGWMLHAGDAYFYRRELEKEGYHCTLGLRFYQRLLEFNHRQRMFSLRRLRDLVIDHGDEVRICSSHDAIELAAYQAQQLPLAEQYEPLRLSQPLPT
ncbi:MAG: MBL fold metallo-hydrolase [Bdellovibrionales bacterium]|nr:MBL fold metallo-hydrolase [Bdellovibrionales bacterium]